MRLGFLRKADDLGVAAVLEVENAVVAPAVLVVANQVALGVGGKGGLAGAGEAEEDGHVAVVADVGGAMHGQHAFERQQEVEHGEDGLLDFAGVVRAADDGQALAEIEDDEGVGAGAVDHGRSQEARHGDHGEFRHVLLQLVLIADLQEHGAREEAVPGLLGDDADGQGVLGIGAGIAVLHKDVAALQVALQAGQQRAEVFAGEGTIVGAPPDAVFRGLLADHKLVRRRARRVLAGVHQHRSQVGQAALGAKHNLFVERRRAQVPVDAPQIHQAVVLQPVVTRQKSGFLGSRGNDVEIDVHSEFLNRR